MNKTELKNFAVSARRYLIEKVALRAKIFGIDEHNGVTIEDKFGQLAINGEVYSNDKKSAVLSLKKQLETKVYEQLIEEVAYTWFNRIIAIRYMEVNDYLPERVNVLSSSTGKVEPDILSQFETMDLDIDTVKIKDLSRQGETEDAYRQLFIAQCNALKKILPFMFEKIQDYTELLLPDFLLDSESIVKKLVSNEALTESFLEVEVIGWLYQFYNSEPKDKIFANLKKNKKIEKYDIPAATQLFTPKWIVQYMVENSLGQLWLESNPDSPLKESMRYFIEPAEQDEEVKQRLEEIRYKNVNLEEITIIDPCVGSGHILVYAFDLLYQMYEEAGYPNGDIPQLILEKNLFGLDIDDRAAQLASFALMMKAREKSRRIFRKKIELNIYAVPESNNLDKDGIVNILAQDEVEKDELQVLINGFIDAKSYGALLQPSAIDYEKYLNRIENLKYDDITLENYQSYEQIKEINLLLKQAQILTRPFDIVVTNPPYMGKRGMVDNLRKYLEINYPNGKNDIYAAFLEHSFTLLKPNGYCSMVTMQSWLFLSTFENLRKEILQHKSILKLLQIGYNSFPGMNSQVAHAASFIIRNKIINGYVGKYFNLNTDSITADKGAIFLEKKRNNDFYLNEATEFLKIPRSTIAYNLSSTAKRIFYDSFLLENVAQVKQGLATGDNNQFLRFWFEVDFNKIGIGIEGVNELITKKVKWVPYNKGGSYRKWYGNQELVVNWGNNGEEIKNFKDEKGKLRSRPQNTDFYFQEGITWGLINTSKFSPRYTPKGFIFDVGGSTAFPRKEYFNYILAFMSSKVALYLLNIIAPTINFQVGDIKSIPIKLLNENHEKKAMIDKLTNENIQICKYDWDSSERSWNFTRHPFLEYSKGCAKVEQVYLKWEALKKDYIKSLINNETNLNRMFIDLNNLNDELNPKVSESEITVTPANREKEVKTFLSYFIGCVMGRYSLDISNLSYAYDEWDESKYKTFMPNKFGLIQLTDGHYFEDDIIARLREFLSATFGAETVEENLTWLAESLELKRNVTAEERLRRYFLDEFFKDHCQVYQKRPIYWLVDSGKEKGLRTLIYMHRYQPDTMATIRFEHLQEIQTKYNYEIAAVDLRIVNPNLSATEKNDLEKRKTTYQKRLEELLEFDKKLAEYAISQISIDLDDGVNINYAKFDKVLAQIK